MYAIIYMTDVAIKKSKKLQHLENEKELSINYTFGNMWIVFVHNKKSNNNEGRTFLGGRAGFKGVK